MITRQHLDVGERMEVTLTVEDPDPIDNPAQLQFILQSRVVWVDFGSGAAGLEYLPDEASRRLAWAF